MMHHVYRAVFRTLCVIGSPFGGVRPRRVYHWLAQRAFGGQEIRADEFRWHRDRWGHRFLLHPYYHIDREVIAFGAYEPDLADFLRARIEPGMVCLDVGAIMGVVTVQMAGLVGPTGRVYAFEPVPHVRERLEVHVRENGVASHVEVHDLALSNSNGTAVLHFAGTDVVNQGISSLVNPDHPHLSGQIQVRTARLDDFVAERGIGRIDWIKVDIQGAEPLFLEGAEQTLSRLAPSILMEVAPTELVGMGWTSRDLLRMLEQRGYRLFHIRGRRIGDRIRADAVADDFKAGNILCLRRD